MDEKTERKKTNIFSQINLKNPFHWWGLILIVIGVISGGAIGGGLGGLCGITIMNLSLKDNFSKFKKIALSILITLGGIILYFALALLLIYILGGYY